MTDTSTASPPYAICDDCGGEFATQKQSRDHASESMTPTSDEERERTGVVARGHRQRIVTPTREEVVQREVDWAIEAAMDSFFESLDRQIDRGIFTEGEATTALRGSDFADGWNEWRVGGDR